MANPTGNPDSLTAPRFEAGQSGNPGGVPKSRARLTTAFLNALAADFEVNGKDAIRECREKKPEAYVRAIAALMPREVEIKSPLQELEDDQLLAAVRLLESFLATRAAEVGGPATRQ